MSFPPWVGYTVRRLHLHVIIPTLGSEPTYSKVNIKQSWLIGPRVCETFIPFFL